MLQVYDMNYGIIMGNRIVHSSLTHFKLLCSFKAYLIHGVHYSTVQQNSKKNGTVFFLESCGTDLACISSKLIFWWTGDPVGSFGVPCSGFQCIMFKGYLIEISEKTHKNSIVSMVVIKTIKHMYTSTSLKLVVDEITIPYLVLVTFTGVCWYL